MRRGKYEAGRDRRPAVRDQVPEEPQKESNISENTPEKDIWQDVVLYIHDLVYLLGIGLMVLLLLFRIVVVSGSSMKDTLVDGDYLLLLSNTFYRSPEYGDIIVASKDTFDNGAPIVKRVIATEGQMVDIDFERGIVYVDGEELYEPYIAALTGRDEGVEFPLVVDRGCIFVMGDNRMVSQDSRSPEVGLIDCREIMGKAIFLFLPGTDRGNISRDFSRIGVLS